MNMCTFSVAAAALRQNGLSALYLILLLYNPAVPVPTSRTMSGSYFFDQEIILFYSYKNVFRQMKDFSISAFTL